MVVEGVVDDVCKAISSSHRYLTATIVVVGDVVTTTTACSASIPSFRIIPLPLYPLIPASTSILPGLHEVANAPRSDHRVAHHGKLMVPHRCRKLLPET